MRRYVDADKMIKDTKAMEKVAEGIMINGIIKYIEDNVVEKTDTEKHSRWQTGAIRMNSQTITCRNCHRTEEISITNCYEYCPHCGAKMDG